MEDLDNVQSGNNLRIKRKWILLTIIIINIIYSSILFLVNGIEWPNSLDANIYANMVEHIDVEPPFKYRYVVPFIVSLFPKDYHKYVFLTITISSLVLICLILYLYLERNNINSFLSLVGVFFFMGSWIYNIYIINFGLIDPLFLVFLILILYLLTFNTENFKIIFLITLAFIIGFFIKESIFFLTPIVMLEAVFKKNKSLFLSVLGVFIFFIVSMLMRETIYNSIPELAIFIFKWNGVNLEGGIIQIIIDITYLVLNGIILQFGLLIFCSVIGFFKSDLRKKLKIIILLLEVSFGFLIATDWWRLISIIFPFIILFGLKPFDDLIKMRLFKGKKDYFLLVLSIIIWMIIGPIWRYSKIIDPYSSILKFITIISVFLGTILFTYYILILKKRSELSYRKILFKKNINT